MFGQIGKKGNYAYVVARVKAKKARLMGSDAYAKMMMMSLPEISRFISETGYQKEMADFAGREEGIDLVEHATYSNMAKLFRDILHSSSGELKEMVAAYLTKWDFWNLKVILRGKIYGARPDSIKDELVPAGSLDNVMLDKLLALETDDDILATFARMKGISFPSDVIAAYKETGILTRIEDYLDIVYYERLLASTSSSSRPIRLFEGFIRKEIDMVNLETILTLKMEGISGEVVMNYVIPGGKQIDKKLATQLANAESMSAAANDLAQLDFYEDIRDALDTDTKSLKDIVAGMKKYQRKQAKTFSHLYPLSVIPVLDFMIHKKIEVDNIRIIARGIESGIDKETIKGLLVI